MRIFQALTSRKRLSTTIACVASVTVTLLTSSLPTFSQTTPTTRDKFLWPFSWSSPWNMPIGANAKYVPANLGKAYYVGADEELFYKLKESDPWRQVVDPGSWTKRCQGKTTHGTLGMWLPVPDNLIVEDAGEHTPNNASAFLMPDGKTIVQIEPLARCQKGGSIYGYVYSSKNHPDGKVDIYGDGIGGAHFGSGLSSIGGSIRLGELTNDQPIRHALKVLLWGNKYLYYSKEKPGYRWPADRADSYAAEAYRGKNPSLVQGSLLAIPPNVTEASLKLQTPAGKKLFHALQNYGGYVADDANWDAHYFAVETGVLEEFRSKYGYDMTGASGPFYEDSMKLFQALQIVDNNGPNNIGGGGTRRAPLAPPISN